MQEEANGAFWRGVRVGDMVSLSDSKTLVDRMKSGKGPTPENYEVKSILAAKSLNNLADWIFLKLDESNGLCLLAKIVDNNLALCVLRDAFDWEPQTRHELVDKDILFMFNEPNNPSLPVIIEDLTYTNQIFEDNEVVNGPGRTEYYMKPQGEMHCKVSILPAQSGMGEQFATIVEYAAEINKFRADPECLILEVGETGGNGVVNMLVGRPLAYVDINVMRR